jgi:hypothetical protein
MTKPSRATLTPASRYAILVILAQPLLDFTATNQHVVEAQKKGENIRWRVKAGLRAMSGLEYTEKDTDNDGESLNSSSFSKIPRVSRASQIIMAMDEFGEVQRVGKSLDLTLISDSSTANTTIGIMITVIRPVRCLFLSIFPR